ncbi:MAG: hypothetical protein ACR2PL_12135 [Dehalococcoidia bacterium]
MRSRSVQGFGLVLCLVMAVLSLLTFLLSGFQVGLLGSVVVFLGLAFLAWRRLRNL